MRFDSPLYLLLLIIIPALAWMGWPSNGAAHKREMLSLILRIIMSVSLIFSLAGFVLVKTSEDLAVVYLLDVSDSVSSASQAAELNYVRDSLKSMKGNDQAAVVVFGKNALVERSMSSSREINAITSKPEGDQTNLPEAIRLGSSLFPAHAARRMVVISDGVNTLGVGLEAAKLAVENGIQIETISTGSLGQAEAMVKGIEAPKHVHEGDRFDLQISLYSNDIVPSTIRVQADDKIVYNRSILLQQGNQTYNLSLVAGQPGFTRFSVQIDPQQDTYYQNNSLATYTQISGPPRVLVVSIPAGEKDPVTQQARQDESGPIMQVLQNAKINAELVDPGEVPNEITGLTRYSAVVLVDIPALSLAQQQMRSLQNYVRNLGGGLVVIGGPSSYGAGGYGQTPLEEALPVDMQINLDSQKAKVSIVFIIDHSGSMGDSSGATSKLELAKQAIIHSIQSLNQADRVGVITFNDSATWVVPMTDITHLANIQNTVEGIQSGGGTDVSAAVQAMADVFASDPAQTKHAILLTDGAGDPKTTADLVKQLYTEKGITLTTIGVGQGSGSYLQQFAQMGGGRYYFTSDAANIPDIFSQETALVGNQYVNEQSFTPTAKSSSPILNGIDVKQFPALSGYVRTTAKDKAQNLLVSGSGDPILSTWQYGLGKAVAFTSDASSHWAQEWLKWSQFSNFWTQTIQFSMQDETSSMLDARIQQNGISSQLFIDAQSESGNYLNAYAMQAQVTDPDNSSQTLTLKQTAPGQYLTPFTTSQEGVYIIRIAGSPPQGGNQPAVNGTFGWSLPYSAEYGTVGSDGSLLDQIAALSSLEKQTIKSNPADIFIHNLSGGQIPQAIWPWLLALVAILLPFDIALRRLLFRPKEFWAGLVHIIERMTGIRLEPSKQVHVKRISTLNQVKQKATQGFTTLSQSVQAVKNNAQGRSIEKEISAPVKVNEEKRVTGKDKADKRGKEANPINQTALTGRVSRAVLLAAKREKNQK